MLEVTDYQRTNYDHQPWADFLLVFVVLTAKGSLEDRDKIAVAEMARLRTAYDAVLFGNHSMGWVQSGHETRRIEARLAQYEVERKLLAYLAERAPREMPATTTA